MKLPSFILEFLTSVIGKRLAGKLPDMYIGGKERPYLARDFVIPRNNYFNIYYHTIFRSDDDRALHDHPWFSISIILSGHYIEHSILAGGTHRRLVRDKGTIVFRRAKTAHRLEIDGEFCRTLFITGPKTRSWGFHCEKRWVHWREFVDPTDTGLVGPGCGETD